ncbi:hypothetical protein F5Y08DRAFT_335789 [Xylaria arbuscula]|nr:hypothetical protein F5Y08DRAFT_335789 [Xylaria arbuscula]
MYELEDKKDVEISHARPFAYKRSTDIRPTLKPYAYKARDLLNCTIASFCEINDKQLTQHQLRAKQEFNSLFRRYAKKQPEELQKAEIYSILKALLGFLDEFFFFGSVTPVIQNFIYTTFPPKWHRIGDCTPVKSSSEIPKFRISLHKHRGARLATLAELVDTLTHEMTHAFLMAYTCPCPKCLKNDYNGIGRNTTGHGPIFRGLSYATMRCLAG